MCGLSHYYGKFANFGVRTIKDLFDDDLIGDEDLMCEIGKKMKKKKEKELRDIEKSNEIYIYI
jgi:hypothetical protein